MMTDISFLPIAGRLWIKYKKISLGSKEKSLKNYFHCSGHRGLRHCAVDVRSDKFSKYTNHKCSFGEEEPVDSHFRRIGILCKEKRVEDSQEGEATEEDIRISEIDQYWIQLQCKLNLSIEAATSNSFGDFVVHMIRLGQTYPSLRTEELFPGCSPFLFMKKVSHFSSLLRTNFINKLKGVTCSLCFDGSSIGDRHFLITYISGTQNDPPTFFDLQEDIMSQSDYAQYASKLVMQLQEVGIEVGSFCTDGLGVQVQALSDLYKGLFFHQYCVSFFLHSIFLFQGQNRL
jgi:hypothetical protein